jgi:hypothetical protein
MMMVVIYLGLDRRTHTLSLCTAHMEWYRDGNGRLVFFIERSFIAGATRDSIVVLL